MIMLRVEEIVGQAHRLLCAARCWQAKRLPYNLGFPWKQNGYKLDRLKRSSLPRWITTRDGKTRWITTSETASAARTDAKANRGEAALNS